MLSRAICNCTYGFCDSRSRIKYGQASRRHDLLIVMLASVYVGAGCGRRPVSWLYAVHTDEIRSSSLSERTL